MTTEAETAQIIENLRQVIAASEAKDKYIERLEARAEAMEKALRRIAGGKTGYDVLVAIARAALEAKP